MKESWNLERIELFSKYLDQHNINYSINNLDESLGTRNTVLQKGVINIEQIL